MIWTFTYVIKISDMWIHGKRPEVKVLMFKLHLFHGKSAFVPKSRCFTCSVHRYICQYEEYLHDCRSIKISWTNRRIADCFTSPPNKLCISSVQLLSCVQLFVTPRTAAPQASPSITSSWSLLKLMSIESVMQSNHLILCCPLFLLPQSLPASGSFSMSQLFSWGGQSIGVSASASVLPMNTQDWSPLGWTGCISCNPRNSQEFSTTPQFKSINSSVLSFLYSPTLTSIQDHWKNHSLD